MKTEIPWSETKTLKETVIEMIKTKRTESKEFQSMLRFFGRERLESIWREYLQEKKKERDSSNEIPITDSTGSSAHKPE